MAYITYGTGDYRGELARAKEFNPDGLVINTSASVTDGTFIRQSRELAMNTQWFGNGNFFTIHAWRLSVGPYTEGMILGGARVDPKNAAAFIRAYRSRLGSSRATRKARCTMLSRSSRTGSSTAARMR